MGFKKGDSDPQNDYGYDNVSVNNSATEIVAANKKRLSLMIQNNGTEPLFIGDASVSSTNYWAVLEAGTAAKDGKGGAWSTAGEKVVYEGAVYGVRATETADASYLEVRDAT